MADDMTNETTNSIESIESIETCQLAIRVGRRERLRLSIIIDSLQATGALLDEMLNGVVWDEPATVLVEMPSGVTHIVGRYPANTLGRDSGGGSAA